VSDFKPPKNNRFFEWLGRTGLPYVLWWNNYEGVSIAPADIEKLQALDGQRTIICSNHSHRHDPIFLFSLGALLNEQFNFIAAREIFDWWPFALHGYCIQRVGAYSITRGTVDRASLSMSKQLILEGKRKLVVFPECEISGSDDRLLPIEPGLAGLFLKSMEAVQQQYPGEPVNVLPVGLKYKYVQDISRALHNSLTRIENELKIDNGHLELPDRFNLAVREWVSIIAAEFRMGHSNWARTETIADFDSIIDGLIEYVADCLGAPVNGKDAPQAVHALRNRLNDILKSDDYVSPYRARVHEQRVRYFSRFEDLFNTIIRLAALREFHVLSGISQENLASGIDLLEREMFGKATQKGQRIVYFKVGDAINLTEHYDQFKQNKRVQVDWLTAEIEQQLRVMLGIPQIERRLDEAA
jgi:1-acyl-sn-glycerol-3-phosphate acyltransferase